MLVWFRDLVVKLQPFYLHARTKQEEEKQRLDRYQLQLLLMGSRQWNVEHKDLVQRNMGSDQHMQKDGGTDHPVAVERNRAECEGDLYYYTRTSTLPSEEQALAAFLAAYPLYNDTCEVDRTREKEYRHLNEDSAQVCLDYAGVGLFSRAQQTAKTAVSSFGLAYISATLVTHALYYSTAPMSERDLEGAIRSRVLRYMNIDEKEYVMVFTASTFSAFKLVGESYPFHVCKKLLLAYDHRCESLDWISECARSKGAVVTKASLMWPSLKLDAVDVRKKLSSKGKLGLESGKGRNTWGFHSFDTAEDKVNLHKGVEGRSSGNQQQHQGLLLYPVISQVSGTKHSLQWVTEAQQNGWHVLLDVSGLGAKAMDLLSLSLFSPDFIIASFYKVFGSDPTGFGCLVIKKTVLQTLGDSSRARAIGMVRIVPMGGGGAPQSPEESPSKASTAVSTSWESRHSSIASSRSLGTASSLETTHLLSQEIVLEDWARSQLPPQLSSVSSSFWSQPGIKTSNSISQHSKEQILESSQSLKLHGNLLSKEQGRNMQDETWHSRTVEQAGTVISGGTKAKTLGIRYLQVPARGTVGSGTGDPHCSEYRSPLKLTLPRGFDSSPGTWSPPLVGSEARQVFAPSSLPDTPSSASAPCSPSYPKLLDSNDDFWLNLGLSQKNDMVCSGLDHIDKIGLTQINIRIKALINWLISSLQRLRHPIPGNPFVALIYGPLCQSERGHTIAFNILDLSGDLLDPILVQRLADRNNISLATGNIQGNFTLEQHKRGDRDKGSGSKPRLGSGSAPLTDLARQTWSEKGETHHMGGFSVVYAALGFLSSFTDVYRLWVFVAQFLDPEFVNRELFHYRALNQQTILM
jgi:selenocysteine lyase/cysteine desulfurase